MTKQQLEQLEHVELVLTQIMEMYTELINEIDDTNLFLEDELDVNLRGKLLVNRRRAYLLRDDVRYELEE